MIFRNYKILLILFLPTIISNLFAQDYLSLTEAQNRLQYLTIEKAKIASEFDTLIKYELEQEADTSPKGEFETTEEYKKRILRGKELLAQIKNKYKSQQKAKEENISIQIRELLEREYIEPVNIRLGKYNADREIFTVYVQANPFTEEVPPKVVKIKPLTAKDLSNDLETFIISKKVGIFCLSENADYAITVAGFEYNGSVYEIDMDFEAKQLVEFNIGLQLDDYVQCFSADSKSLAISGLNNGAHIYLINLEDFSYKAIVKNKNNTEYDKLLFSPDGKELIANSDMSLDVWDLESSSLIVSFKDNRYPINQIYTDFGIDINYKKSLLASGSGEKITLYDTKTWAIKDIINLGSLVDVVEALAFHPSGNLIAFQGKDNKIHLVNVNTKKIQKKLNVASRLGAVKSLSFSPDGKYLAVGSNPTVVVDFMRDSLIRAGYFNGAKYISFSPDKYFFESGYLVELQNRRYRQFLGRNSFGGPLKTSGVFSPNGRYIASWNKLWQVVKRKENGISISEALVKLDEVLAIRNEIPSSLITQFNSQTGRRIQKNVQLIHLNNDYFPEYSIVSGDATYIYRRTGNRFELLLSEIYSFKSHPKTLTTLSNGWRDIEISWTLDQVETKITFKYDGKKYVEKSFQSSGIE